MITSTVVEERPLGDKLDRVHVLSCLAGNADLAGFHMLATASPLRGGASTYLPPEAAARRRIRDSAFLVDLNPFDHSLASVEK